MSEDVVMTFTGVDDVSQVIAKINAGLKDIDKTSEQAKPKTEALTGAIKGLGVAALSYFSIQKLTDSVKFCIAEAIDGQTQFTKLSATLAATGGISGLTASQLVKMAEGLQDITTFSDDAVIAGQSVLLTFKNLSGETFVRAQKAMVDMAAKMGKDLPDAALLLGKALDSPSEGLGALTKAGLRLSSDQENLIKKMVSVNDITGAQAIILKEVESRFGGVAEAMAKTDAGKLEQAKVKIDNLAESIGTKLLPSLAQASKDFADWAVIVGDATSVVVDFAGKIPLLPSALKLVVSPFTAFFRDVGIAIKAIASLKKEAADTELPITTTKTTPQNNTMSFDEVDIVAITNKQDEAIKAAYDQRVKRYKVISGEMAALGEENARIEWERQQEAAKKIYDLDKKRLDDVRNIEREISLLGLSESEKRIRTIEEDYAKRLELHQAGSQAEIDLKRLQAEEIKAVRDSADAQEAEREALKKEKAASDEAELLDKRRQSAGQAIDLLGVVTNSVDSISQIVYQKQAETLDKESARQKKSVNDSKMSSKAKADALAKIDEEAAKKRHEIALKEWRMNLIMSIVNTAMAVSKTLASMPMPAAIPMVIMAGIAGAATIATIAANKPELEQGGFVNGQSYSGDKVDISVNSGEAVLNARQQRNFMALANNSMGGSQGVTFGDFNTIINGNASSDTVNQINKANEENRTKILEMLYESKRLGEIDYSRISI